MKKKLPLRFVVGPLVLAASLAWLVTSSMRATTMRVVPVEDLHKAEADYAGQRLRVAGFIGKDGARKQLRQTESGEVHVSRFQVTDEKGGRAMLVEYRDALPDTFRKGGPVQVDGVYQAGGKMNAEHVFTKCPSKYEADKAAGKGTVKKDAYKKPNAQTGATRSAKLPDSRVAT